MINTAPDDPALAEAPGLGPATAQEASDTTARTLSATTARIYAAAWAAFQAWCRAQDMECLPAAPHTVATYLASRSPAPGRSGLRVALAAIAHRHRQAGHPWDGCDPAIVGALSTLQARAPRPRQAATLATGEIRHLVATCDGPFGGAVGLCDCRDRALLLVAFAAGLRRSELVALDHDDVRLTAGGMTLRLKACPRPGAAPAEVVVARELDASLCAVRALEAWLRRAGIGHGAVFLRLTAAGTIEGRLTGNGVWKILRRRAGVAGLVVPGDGRVSPQALRRGARARGA